MGPGPVEGRPLLVTSRRRGLWARGISFPRCSLASFSPSVRAHHQSAEGPGVLHSGPAFHGYQRGLTTPDVFRKNKVRAQRVEACGAQVGDPRTAGWQDTLPIPPGPSLHCLRTWATELMPSPFRQQPWVNFTVGKLRVGAEACLTRGLGAGKCCIPGLAPALTLPPSVVEVALKLPRPLPTAAGGDQGLSPSLCLGVLIRKTRRSIDCCHG